MIKKFNFKFSVDLRWPFTFKKTDEEDQPHIPRVSEILVSSTHHGVSTTQQIKIDSNGFRLTKKSGYTKPDKRYRQYLEATGSGDRPIPKKFKGGKQRGINYFKTIGLKHDGISEKEIAEQLNISQPRVNQLWNEYIKSSQTHKTMYSKKAHQSVSQPKRKSQTSYNEKFITDAVTQALDTSRIEVRNRYNLPESTLRQWIQRYEQSVQEHKDG